MHCQVPVEPNFPVWALLPKIETGASSFLTKYPEYDGRGTVIAILDSGVDPGAPGLQITSDGKVKVVERFDCSGCGDVNTSTIVKAEDGIITGLTGRKLKIPNNWTNPTGVYRIGVKNAFNLYPERLRDRMKTEYKKKKFDEGHRSALSELCRDLAKLEASSKNFIETEDKSEKEDCDAKVELLVNVDKKFSDSGPVYDCVLFHDGSKWMCCVNNSEDNDLSKCPLLGEYSVTHEYLPLTKLDSLNFSFNVHDNGNILELVGVSSSHATHVASIAAAYFPDKTVENGVAPGAQVISLTIGDGRLGSMETGTALIRAMIKIIELKQKMNVHVINMSYGEHAHWVDTGRIGELINEVVNKYGVTWVSSAGNNGPALNTISTPSDINDEPIISVGAYVSPDMMVAEYAMQKKLPGSIPCYNEFKSSRTNSTTTYISRKKQHSISANHIVNWNLGKGSPYTWSSRGPTIDGGVGVHVCAPGGAITSVPNFTLRYSQLMNGTSMSSPNCAGAICLMLSGLIQKNIPFSPYSIRRALENTASFINGVEIPAQGAGLIQVDKAFEHLLAYSDAVERDVRFQLQCGSSTGKGIYIRSKLQNPEQTFKVSVEPNFLNDEDTAAETKIKFNMRLSLTSPCSYVQFPKHLDLSNIARMFAVTIDTAALPHGLHSSFISAYDSACVDKGAVFKIPITIIQAIDVPESNHTVSHEKVVFQPNTIKRHYYHVPSFATWAVLKLNSNEDSGRFVVHTMQCLPRQHCRTMETSKNVPVTSKIPTVLTFQVKGDLVLEVVIAKYWANSGEAILDYEVSFFGVKPNQPSVTMHAVDGIHTVEVRTLQGEEMSPAISLKNSVQILKPSENKITPLTARDIIPPSRQIYELVLVYNFSITKPCEVSPNFALLSNMLYESEFESQLWMLFDNNKQLLGTGDAYPSKYNVKLEKGEYVIRLQVRHDKKDYLEKLNEAPLLLQQKLTNSITMDVYTSYAQALIGGKKAGITQNANPHSVVSFYIAPLPADRFSVKANNAAHFLTGTITYAKDDAARKADVYPFKYILQDNSSPKKISNGNNSSEKPKSDEFNDCMRDLRTAFIAKLDKEAGEKMYEELVQAYPNYMPIHSAYLQLIDPMDKKMLPVIGKKPTGTVEELKKVIEVCDKVLLNVNEEAVLAYIATKTELRNEAAKYKAQMDQQKTVYLECLARKGSALCRISLLENSDETIKEDIAKIWKALVKFVDPTDAKILTTHVLYFAIWHAFVKQQYGRLLKYLNKLQEEKASEEVEKRIIQVVQELKWKHLVDYLERMLPSKFPSTYCPF